MAKTPFEVRLNVLEIAKDLAVSAWQEGKQQKVEPYYKQVDRLKNDEVVPPYPAIDAFPSEADILVKAKSLYAFVMDDTKPNVA